MKNRSLVLLFIMICLTGGVLIYTITRTETIYINQWLSHIGNGKALLFLQGLFQNGQIPQWIIYSLPDALWMSALMLLILMIWNFKLHLKSIPWVVMAILTGVSYEIFQGYHLIRGTYDPVDLLFIMIGAFLPISFTLLKICLCKTS